MEVDFYPVPHLLFIDLFIIYSKMKLFENGNDMMRHTW